MKWSEVPIWLKAIIILGAIFLILWILDQIDKHVENTQADLKEKLRNTQIELQGLIAERRHVQRLLVKVQNYVNWTLRAVKLFLVFTFIGFIFFLVQFYGTDIFTAVGTAGAFVGTIYIIVAWLLNSKINNLKELEQQVSKVIEQLYRKKFNVNPARVVAVDRQIILLDNRAKEIQLRLKE